MKRSSLLLSGAPLALALAAMACGPTEAAAEAPEAEHAEHAGEVRVDPRIAAAQGIRVARAELRVLQPVLTVPARVTLSQDGLARVVSPVAGRIVAIPVQTGDAVAAGDVLAILESPDYAAAQREFLLATNAEAAAGKPEALARESWLRAQELHEASGDPSRAEVQRREAEVLRLEAERMEAEGRAQQAKERLRGMGMGEEKIATLLTSAEPTAGFALRSPLDGRVIERAASIGQFAGPEDAPVVTVADLERLWVLASFPESRLRELQLGAEAMVLLESVPDHGCPGTVVFISPVLDLATRTVEVRILPRDHHADLRPGLFARVEVDVAGDGNFAGESVAVPEAAVLHLDGVSAVFVPVAGEPGAFAPRTVRAGRPVHGWIPILAGLAAGEECVVEGGFLLKAELEKGAAGHDH